MEPTIITFEDWTLRVRPPAGKPVRVLLMLHGWTGDEMSMWFLARNFDDRFWLLAPRAPYSTPQRGFSWRPPFPEKEYPPTYEQMRISAAMLLDLIDRWGIANAVDVNMIDIMGFSQGAAQAITFALTYPKRIRKMGVLAGFAPKGIEQLVSFKPLEGKPVFITHGVSDELVPIETAHTTLKLLEQAGACVTFCEAEIGHKVSAECLRALEAFFSPDS
jgi:phospholipase/carboxylesterase